MKFVKLLIIILFILYIISPIDLIPDFLFPLGWLDDAVLAWILFNYLRQGSFPGGFFRTGGPYGAGRQSYHQSEGAGSHARNRTGQTLKDPYTVLGLKPGATPEEIRTAYRRAVKTYHPDKVTHLGEDFQQLAKQKFVEIQEAYSKLTGK